MPAENLIVCAHQLRSLLLAALSGALNDAQRAEAAELVEKCNDAADSRLIAIAHAHRHGTDVGLVRMHASDAFDSARLQAQLVEFDSDRFEFHLDEFLDASLDVEVIDVRAIEPRAAQRTDEEVPV